MEQERKNKTKAIMVIALAVCLVSIAVTAAYFIVNIRANNQELTVTTGTMALTFSDNSDGINQALMFGESVTKDFKIENTGTLPAVAKISFDDLVNTYLAESLTYTLSYATSETGTYTTVKSANVPRSEDSSKVELAGNLTIPAGKTYYYRLTIKLEYLEDIDQTEDLNASFSTRFTLDEDRVGEDTYTVNVSGLTLEVNRKNPNFRSADITDSGVYAMADDYGTSYYFRGAVENNYVKFGKWADDIPDVYIGYNSSGSNFNEYNTVEACQNNATYNQDCALVSRAGKDMYWRIIRVNGDGSVRMIYDGTSTYANSESSADRSALRAIWNTTNYNDAKYVGYMYGGANGEISTAKTEIDCDGQTDCVAAQKNEIGSNIKTVLENWYTQNLKDNYGQYIADAIFCNDRSTSEIPNTWSTSDTALGYGANQTYYGVSRRLRNLSGISSVTPTFVCPQDNDKFTVNSTTSGGNAALNEPVGMIIADEIIAAGMAYQSYYLYKVYMYWTFSPSDVNNNGHAGVYYVSETGGIGANRVSYALAVAPVINLTPEYAKTMLGTGTLLDPYRSEE